jgi:hypothetical protein
MCFFSQSNNNHVFLFTFTLRTQHNKMWVWIVLILVVVVGTVVTLWLTGVFGQRRKAQNLQERAVDATQLPTAPTDSTGSTGATGNARDKQMDVSEWLQHHPYLSTSSPEMTWPFAVQKRTTPEVYSANKVVRGDYSAVQENGNIYMYRHQDLLLTVESAPQLQLCNVDQYGLYVTGNHTEFWGLEGALEAWPFQWFDCSYEEGNFVWWATSKGLKHVTFTDKPVVNTTWYNDQNVYAVEQFESNRELLVLTLHHVVLVEALNPTEVLDTLKSPGHHYNCAGHNFGQRVGWSLSYLWVQEDEGLVFYQVLKGVAHVCGVFPVQGPVYFTDTAVHTQPYILTQK